VLAASEGSSTDLSASVTMGIFRGRVVGVSMQMKTLMFLRASCTIRKCGLVRVVSTWQVFLNLSSIARYCATPLAVTFFFFSLLASRLCRAARMKCQLSPHDLCSASIAAGANLEGPKWEW
jgi:hypothetical protein